MRTNTPTGILDSRSFRDTLGHYASGLTIIGGVDQGEPVGFTCQAFYSVSMEPPLVSFSVTTTSTSYPRIRRTGRFSVNVLAHHQEAVSNQFARRGTDKWADIQWRETERGNPVISETLMWLDCDLWSEHEAGDHLIVIGHVLDMGRAEEADREPLLFFKGRYRHLQAPNDSLV